MEKLLKYSRKIDSEINKQWLENNSPLMSYRYLLLIPESIFLNISKYFSHIIGIMETIGIFPSNLTNSHSDFKNPTHIIQWDISMARSQWCFSSWISYTAYIVIYCIYRHRISSITSYIINLFSWLHSQRLAHVYICESCIFQSTTAFFYLTLSCGEKIYYHWTILSYRLSTSQSLQRILYITNRRITICR